MLLFRYGCIPEDLVTVCVSLLHMVPGRGNHSCLLFFLHGYEADVYEKHRSAGHSIFALLCKTIENDSDHFEFGHNSRTKFSKCIRCTNSEERVAL